MKKMFPILITLLTATFASKAQAIPNVNLSTLNGAIYSTKQLNEIASKPIIISFWATWCIPCLNELSAINDNLDDWKKELKFELYAISQDDSRTAKRVPALVNGKGWMFTVLLDQNQDLKRELNIMNIPYTIVVKDGKIIYRQASYVAGNENELYNVLKQNQ